MLVTVYVWARPDLSLAQDSAPAIHPILPIPVEFMGGNRAFSFNTQINKYFSATSPINFLSITSSSSPYKNDLKNFDFINTSQLSYNLRNGLGVSAGINMNAKTGFNPDVGLQYVYASDLLLVVLAPGFLLASDQNVQAVGVLECRPSLAKSFRLYLKLQGFYNYNVRQGFTQRSYFYSRVGLLWGLLCFGPGADLDWYGGPTIVRKENYGLFVRYSFP